MKFGGDKPKGKGALAALVIGAPSSTSDLDEEETDHGFRAVARAFGIPKEREASAQAALKQYIKSCVGDGYEEEDEEL